MLKTDAHKRALERFDKIVDLDHVRSCEQVQADMWAGKTPQRIPAVIYFPPPPEWPTYPFTETWDDVEKKFMNALGMAYCGALLKDDKLLTLTPEYGVVNIPELFGVPSIVSDVGWSMSEGVQDLDTVRALIDRGVPDLRSGHGAKTEAFLDFGAEVVAQYENLSEVLHFVVPDNQGPFDLAHLIWGQEIFYALYDHPDVVHQLLDLATETYIEFSHFYKQKLGEPADSAYHTCGVRLVRGGVRICDDTPVLCSADTYREFIRPYNERAYTPFSGGWLHYCGNGNHLLEQMLATPGVNAVHMGNPDHCDLYELYQQMRAAEVVLIWSGSLERLGELRADNGGRHPTGLMILTENRYASADLDHARADLQRVRDYQPIAKAPY